jgi:hypothetical protein
MNTVPTHIVSGNSEPETLSDSPTDAAGWVGWLNNQIDQNHPRPDGDELMEMERQAHAACPQVKYDNAQDKFFIRRNNRTQSACHGIIVARFGKSFADAVKAASPQWIAFENDERAEQQQPVSTSRRIAQGNVNIMDAVCGTLARKAV